MALYGIPEQTNNTQQPGDGNLWWQDTINTGLNAFFQFLIARYGQQQAQVIISNPNSSTYGSEYQQFLMQKQSSDNSNKTILYVALAAVGLMAIMMMSNNNSKK